MRDLRVIEIPATWSVIMLLNVPIRLIVLLLSVAAHDTLRRSIICVHLYVYILLSDQR